MGRPGKSRFQRQQRAQARLRSEQEFSSVPHSFVFPRGRPGRSLRSLCKDLRRVLEPFTARNLQVRRSNSLRDLVAVAGPLGVTQFLVLSKSQTGVNLKIFRLPGGPTLTFKVLQYSLVRDVVSALRRHRMHEQQFLHPPLLVLGNFGARARAELRLMAGMFQGMFPALNVHRVNLNSIRRCLLISYDADSQLLEFRHYVQVVPVGLSRGLRKILQEKFPNLGRMDDISQLLTGDVVLSESEAEPDGSQNVLELPQNCAGRGNAVTQQSAIRLTEIGPRLTLQLLKVEEGLGQGNVLYHGLAPKGEEELRELLARRERRLQVRAERRRQQEQNLERKRKQRERHRFVPWQLQEEAKPLGRAPSPETTEEEPKIHPRNPKIHPRNPKIHTWNPKIHPRNPKIHPRNPKIHTWKSQISSWHLKIPTENPKIPTENPKIPSWHPKIPPRTPQKPQIPPQETRNPQIPTGNPKIPTWNLQIPPGTPQKSQIFPRTPQKPQIPPGTPQKSQIPPGTPQKPQIFPRTPQKSQMPSWEAPEPPENPKFPSARTSPKKEKLRGGKIWGIWDPPDPNGVGNLGSPGWILGSNGILGFPEKILGSPKVPSAFPCWDSPKSRGNNPKKMGENNKKRGKIWGKNPRKMGKKPQKRRKKREE
ncbi:suppressor of SWI4 1 homolog isoform X3 [Agelaius tricolor]|uniref:suppressor of SWI4 1 homolog isoform X3 n=1 Tax=Agelaius tricolor TaxID=9191 RepID=UPI0039F1DE12